MNELPFYATGNLTRDPELSFTSSGTARAFISLVINPRRYDAQTGQWVDGTPTFVDGTIWGPQAENAAESLSQGDRVIASGRWVTSVFTAEKGERAGQEVRKLAVVIDRSARASASQRRSPSRPPGAPPVPLSRRSRPSDPSECRVGAQSPARHHLVSQLLGVSAQAQVLTKLVRPDGSVSSVLAVVADYGIPHPEGPHPFVTNSSRAIASVLVIVSSVILRDSLSSSAVVRMRAARRTICSHSVSVTSP